MYESIRKYIILIHKIVNFMMGNSSFETQCRFEVEFTGSASRMNSLPRRTKELRYTSVLKNEVQLWDNCNLQSC